MRKSYFMLELVMPLNYCVEPIDPEDMVEAHQLTLEILRRVLANPDSLKSYRAFEIEMEE